MFRSYCSNVAKEVVACFREKNCIGVFGDFLNYVNIGFNTWSSSSSPKFIISEFFTVEVFGDIKRGSTNGDSLYEEISVL